LKRVVAQNRHCTAEEIVAAILQQVATFTRGAVAQDDRTLLVVRRGSSPPPERRASAEVAIPAQG
jgi:serine phosphatase RsbU (regulator of sigma subunit)